MKLSEIFENNGAKLPTLRFQSIEFVPDVPKGTPYVYIITNKNDILQIGSSNQVGRGRLAALMHGVRPQIHNKSFIVGIAEQVM